MKTVTIHKAKTTLSQLVVKANTGQEIVISGFDGLPSGFDEFAE